VRPSTIATYASALCVLSRYCLHTSLPLPQQIELALAEYAKSVGPSRLWTTVSALTFAHKLRLLPEISLTVCQFLARGHSASAETPVRQLWFHPADLHILSSMDGDFQCAALLSFDLMLRCGQLELLTCGDLDHATRSVWCPPHKSLRFPYLRQPSADVWQRLVRLQAGRPAQARLFKRSAHEYSQMLGSLTEETLQVRLTWHALRRGGATARAHAGQSAEAIRRFGCWSSDRAVSHYIFPWSELQLRHYHAYEAAPPPGPSTGGSPQQPSSKRSTRPPAAQARRPAARIHGRLPARQAATPQKA
jgi:hypothetical protein